MTKLSPQELAAAHQCIKDIFRSRPFIPFHETEFYSSLPSGPPKQFDDTESGHERLRAALAAAIDDAEKACPGLQIRLRNELRGFDVSVAGDAEWADALRYAYDGDEDATRKLSTSSAELLARVENGELTSQFRSELSVRHRIRLFGFGPDFQTLLSEIRAKKGIEIKMEQDGDAWPSKKHFLRFAIISRHDPVSPPRGYNPVVPAETGRLPSRRTFHRWFFKMLVEAPFTGDGPALVWSIHTRREFQRCLPSGSGEMYNRGRPVSELLAGLRSHPAFKVGWDFGHRSSFWTVTAAPTASWDETRSALNAELSKPTTESEFAISSPAAVLYDWVNSLPASALDFGLTPEVRNEISKSQLLLDCPWSGENFRLFLELLCEEINTRTPLDLRVVDWHQSGSTLHRIRAKKRDACIV